MKVNEQQSTQKKIAWVSHIQNGAKKTRYKSLASVPYITIKREKATLSSYCWQDCYKTILNTQNEGRQYHKSQDSSSFGEAGTNI